MRKGLAIIYFYKCQGLLKIESAVNLGGGGIKLNLQRLRISWNVTFNFYVLSDKHFPVTIRHYSTQT